MSSSVPGSKSTPRTSPLVDIVKKMSEFHLFVKWTTHRTRLASSRVGAAEDRLGPVGRTSSPARPRRRLGPSCDVYIGNSDTATGVRDVHRPQLCRPCRDCRFGSTAGTTQSSESSGSVTLADPGSATSLPATGRTRAMTKHSHRKNGRPYTLKYLLRPRKMPTPGTARARALTGVRGNFYGTARSLSKPSPA